MKIKFLNKSERLNMFRDYLVKLIIIDQFPKEKFLLEILRKNLNKKDQIRQDQYKELKNKSKRKPLEN